MLKLVTASAPVLPETIETIGRVIPQAEYHKLNTGADAWVVDEDVLDPDMVRGFLRGTGIASRVRQAPAYIQRWEPQELLARLERMRRVSRDVAATIPTLTKANARYGTAFLEALAREQDPALMNWGHRLQPNLYKVLARSARIRHQQAEALCQIYGRIAR